MLSGPVHNPGYACLYPAFGLGPNDEVLEGGVVYRVFVLSVYLAYGYAVWQLNGLDECRQSFCFCVALI